MEQVKGERRYQLQRHRAGEWIPYRDGQLFASDRAVLNLGDRVALRNPSWPLRVVDVTTGQVIADGRDFWFGKVVP